MKSIRTRLVTGTLLGMTVFFAAGAFGVYRLVRARAIEALDRTLWADFQANAPAITAGLLRARPGGPPQNAPPRGPFPDPSSRVEFVFEAWSSDGNTKSAALGAFDLPRLARALRPPPFAEVAFDAESGAWLDLPHDGTRARTLAIAYVPPPRPGAPTTEFPPPIELVLARPAGDVLATLQSVRWLLAGTWLACVLASGLILLVVVRTSLAPLHRLQAQLEEVDEARLERRFELAHAPIELEPVIERLNALLDRLQQAFAREQAFTSDVAHELRTPIAGIHATLEVLLLRARTTAEHEEAARQCLEIARQMQRLVESFLELRRLESERTAVERRPVSLAEALERCRRPLMETAKSRSLEFEDDVPRDLVLATDPTLLDRVLTNLFSNAVEYSSRGGTVEFRARELDGHTVELELANPAEGLPGEIAERAFDAFWRADGARSDVGRHAGIGLSLCKRIIERLGGSIRAEADSRRFAVILALPR